MGGETDDALPTPGFLLPTDRRCHPRSESAILEEGLSSELLDSPKMELVADPRSVKVNKTTGTGMDIEWKDGHRSAYSFVFLRNACPCALCQEEREKDGREPGDPLKPVAGALPIFKALARPTEVEPVGKYGIRFTWNDGHQHGIYSWEFLREHCPCEDCKARRLTGAAESSGKPN